MSFLISDAWAEGGTAAQPGLIEALFPFVILFVVFYFLLIRPQSKRAKEHKMMIEALAKGDEIITSGGLLGKISEMGESFIVVELADSVLVRLERRSISKVMPKGTIKAL